MGGGGNYFELTCVFGLERDNRFTTFTHFYGVLGSKSSNHFLQRTISLDGRQRGSDRKPEDRPLIVL